MRNAIVLLYLLIAVCVAKGQKEVRILFIGNSLTYTNDLPKLFDKASAKLGVKSTSISIAKANYALEDHWKEGNAQAQIRKMKFDYVVLQQGPSSQKDGRTSLIKYGKKFKSIVEESGGEVVFFMVWPARNYDWTYDGVIENYTRAAKLNDSILAPVGQRWREEFTVSERFDFIGLDGFHPSLKGSKCAAEIIAESIFISEE